MHESLSLDRRALLIAGAGTIITSCVGCASTQPEKHADSDARKGDEHGSETEEDVAPAEDLMREHGVLNRVLLVYEECANRIENKRELPPEPLADAAKLVRTFIEDYHEKLEEDHLFPRYRAANTLIELVETLTLQHKAGRVTTNRIESLSTLQSLRDPRDSRELALRMRQFIRMYRPHEAREDTILFPALHRIVSRNEYDAMGEEFERIEHRQLGEEGFERAVEHIADIEKRLGIYELGQFTPAP